MTMEKKTYNLQWGTTIIALGIIIAAFIAIFLAYETFSYHYTDSFFSQMLDTSLHNQDLSKDERATIKYEMCLKILGKTTRLYRGVMRIFLVVLSMLSIMLIINLRMLYKVHER